MSFKSDVDKLNKDLGAKMGSLDDEEYLSTGSTALDNALGGGMVKGQWYEYYGMPSAGKTTLALCACASAQKEGIRCLYLDTEHALSGKLARIMGVDTDKDKFMFYRPKSAEECLNLAWQALSKKLAGLIVIDSIAQLVPLQEVNGDMTDRAIGTQAYLLKKAGRLLSPICFENKAIMLWINHITYKIGVVYGNPETTPGGTSLPFKAYGRVEIRKGKPIQEGKEILGHTIKCKVVKNKDDSPNKTAEISLIYGQKPDEVMDMLSVALEKGVLIRAGSWIKLGEDNLEQGLPKVRKLCENDPNLLKRIRELLQSNMETTTDLLLKSANSSLGMP